MTTISSTLNEPLQLTSQPGALLEFVLYEPRESSTAETTRLSYVDEARAVCVAPRGSYVDDARRSATDRSGSGGDVPTIAVEIGSTAVELPLAPDQLLEALTTIYAVEGWDGIRRASDALDFEMNRRLNSPAPDQDLYGTRASDPALDPRNQGADVSGVSPIFDFSSLPKALQSSDIAAQEAERERWQEAKVTFEAARDLLAVAILNALEHIEQLATNLCVVGLNRGRDLAAGFWARYGAEKLHIGTQHGAFGAKEIYKYSLSREDERKSLKKALEPLLALIAEINRLEQLSDRLHGGGGTEGGGGSDVGPTLGQVTERLTTALTTFERQLNTSRAEHPLVAALMLTLEPGFDDDALSKQTVILLDTMIRVAEKFEPPMSRVASLSRKPADWPTALYHGPEHWLADLLSLNRTRLEPLTHEPLLAELLNDEDAELDAFQYIVFMHYLKALGRGPEAARKAEQKFDANLAKVVRDLGLVNIALNFAAVFVPPLRPVVVALDAALTVYGAITMAKAALEFDATFRTAVQERLLAVAKNATINDLNELGQVLASAPSSEQLALMLLQAGISLRVTAATLRLFPTRWLGFLQKLDIVLSLT